MLQFGGHCWALHTLHQALAWNKFSLRYSPFCTSSTEQPRVTGCGQMKRPTTSKTSSNNVPFRKARWPIFVVVQSWRRRRQTNQREAAAKGKAKQANEWMGSRQGRMKEMGVWCWCGWSVGRWTSTPENIIHINRWNGKLWWTEHVAWDMAGMQPLRGLQYSVPSAKRVQCTAGLGQLNRGAHKYTQTSKKPYGGSFFTSHGMVLVIDCPS